MFSAKVKIGFVVILFIASLFVIYCQQEIYSFLPTNLSLHPQLLQISVSDNNQNDDDSNQININTKNAGSIWETYIFQPMETIVYIDTPVSWKNNDSRVHTINVTNSQGDIIASSSYLAPGDTFTHTFTMPGKYPFYSDLATHYSGNIFVLDNGNNNQTQSMPQEEKRGESNSSREVSVRNNIDTLSQKNNSLNVNIAQNSIGFTSNSNTNEFRKFYNEGVQLLKEGNYEGALQSFDEATKLNISKANAWHNKGLTLDKLNRYDEAIMSFDIAISLDPTVPATWNAKGTTLFNKGLYNESIASYDKAIELEPKNTEYQNNKQIALKKISESNIIPENSSQEVPAIKVNTTQSNDLITLYNEGTDLFEAGKYEEALVYYDKALAIDPDDVDTLNNKGATLINLGRYDEALVYLNKGLTIAPTDVDLLVNKGSSLEGLENYNEALVYYDKALAKDPNNTDTLFGKGNSLDWLERYEEALVYYDKALAIDPEHSDTLNNKGFTLYNLGKYQEAISYIDKALAIDPTDEVYKANKDLVQSALSDEKSTDSVESESQRDSKIESTSEEITIGLNSTWFEWWEDDSNNHEIYAWVDYSVKNPSFRNSIINGIMNVYSLDGDLIKSYSYPDGFTVSDSGTVEFSTSLDEGIDKVMLKIHFTDLDKKKILSNEVTTKVED